MLRNILGLRERRVADVMVPRADIIAVQRDIALGELMKVFESAGHSRLVVYDETLDDAVGMVHIRDLVAFMTARAAASAKANTRRKKPFPAGLDLKAVDLSMPLSAAKIMREILFVPPSMPVLDLLAKMQTTRIHLALVVDEYGGADGVVSIEDIVEQIVGEIADEHDEDTRAGRRAPGRRLVPRRCAAPSSRTSPRSSAPNSTSARWRKEVDTLAGYVATRDRPRAGARRTRSRPRPVRDRNRRCRSAPGEEAADLSQLDRERPSRDTAASGGDSVPRQRAHGGKCAANARPSAPRRRPLRRQTHRARPQLPDRRDASVKLSPDAAPSKSARRP